MLEIISPSAISRRGATLLTHGGHEDRHVRAPRRELEPHGVTEKTLPL